MVSSLYVTVSGHVYPCVTEANSQPQSVCPILLVYFVRHEHKLYGPEFLVYNVHSLLHFADNAVSWVRFDTCSGFAFAFAKLPAKHEGNGSLWKELTVTVDEENSGIGYYAGSK